MERYDIRKDYAWNFDHSPEPILSDVPKVDGEWSYCGQQVDSPLGIAAGPLLNGRWLLYYASLGFDILTYKTVRSRESESYGLPNLQPVDWPSGRARLAHLSWAGWERPSAWPSRPDRVRAGEECSVENRPTLRPLIPDHLGRQAFHLRPCGHVRQDALPQPPHRRGALGRRT